MYQTQRAPEPCLTTFCEQLETLDQQLPGGLAQYVQSAKTLLQNSLDGKTPFDGFSPAVPEGQKLPVSALLSHAFNALSSENVHASASKAPTDDDEDDDPK